MNVTVSTRPVEIFVDSSTINTAAFLTTGQSGLFYPMLTNPSGYITSSQIQGVNSLIVSGQSFSGNIILTGAGNIYTMGSGPNIIISGSDASSNTGILTGIFFPLTGKEQLISTIIPSGIDNKFINYNFNFSSIPYVFPSLELYNNVGYFICTSGVTTSGYTIIFSDIIRETGLIIQTIVKI